MILLGTLLAALLEMDHLDTEVVDGDVIYKFKTTSLVPSFAEIKAKILSILDLPVDIPKNIEVIEVKRGRFGFKEYLVKIWVDRTKIGKATDLIAKKYGIVRRRPYSGEI